MSLLDRLKPPPSEEADPEIDVYDAFGNGLCSVCWGKGLDRYICPRCGRWPLDDEDEDEEEESFDIVSFFFGPK
jgi:hypothetical protein